MGYAHAMAEHVGGWTHIEIWVEMPNLGDLVDDVGMIVWEHARENGVDPHIDGSLDADPPEWASCQQLRREYLDARRLDSAASEA